MNLIQGLKKRVKGDNTRERTRPGRAERGSVNERGKGTDLTIEQPVSTQQSVSASTSNRSDQPRINDWLNNQSQRNETNEIPESDNEEDFQSVNGNPDQAADLNIAPIHILLDIQRSIKVLNTKFSRMDKSMRDLQKENNTLKQENVELKKQIEMLDLKVEHMEAQSRRENLKFFNVPESDRESWTESKNMIRKYLKDDLKFDESKISIERAHRLHSKSKPRPLIVKFSFYKDKDRILQAYREKRKSDRTNETNGERNGDTPKIGVSEDFPQRVNRIRQCLTPFMQDAIKNGRKANLQYDKLVVDGKRFLYDSEKKCPTV